MTNAPLLQRGMFLSFHNARNMSKRSSAFYSFVVNHTLYKTQMFHLRKEKTMVTEVVYHGTVRNFELEDMRKPAFFTSNPRIAKWVMYHHERKPGTRPRLITAKIKAEKVYEIDWTYESWGGGFFPSDDKLFEEFVRFAAEGDDEEATYWQEEGMCVDMFMRMMEEKGYDLVICRNVREECGMTGDMYIVLNEGKILSE